MLRGRIGKQTYASFHTGYEILGTYQQELQTQATFSVVILFSVNKIEHIY